MNVMALLGSEIKQRRLSAGITLSQAATQMGMSEEMYERLEKGHLNISLNKLEKASRMLNTTVRDLTLVLEEASEQENEEPYRGN